MNAIRIVEGDLRVGGREGNKGADAARAAIELANLMRKLGD